MEDKFLITYGLSYDVKQQYRDRFINTANATIKAMGSIPGHIKTILFSNVNKPNSLMIYSEWETAESMANFMRSSEFKNVQNMSKDMLESQPQHKMYKTETIMH